MTGQANINLTFTREEAEALLEVLNSNLTAIHLIEDTDGATAKKIAQREKKPLIKLMFALEAALKSSGVQ